MNVKYSSFPSYGERLVVGRRKSSAIYKHIYKDDEKNLIAFFICSSSPRSFYLSSHGVALLMASTFNFRRGLQNTFRCSFNLKTVFNGKISRLRRRWHVRVNSTLCHRRLAFVHSSEDFFRLHLAQRCEAPTKTKQHL